jgi:secreted trypsin-like serine protease
VHRAKIFAILLSGACIATASTAEALVLAEDPAAAVVAPGAMEGVPKVGSCGGALLWDRMHVLTAAHCSPASGGTADVTFVTAHGNVVIGATATVNPGWNSTLGVNGGNDLAILTLSSIAPTNGHQIYRSTPLNGPTPIELAGYGAFGTGGTGATSAADGNLRVGTNTYDVIYSPSVGGIAGGPYLFDLDDGSATHDAVGGAFAVHNLGTGDTEAMLARGDSGGPSFIDGMLAGIHSFVLNPGPTFLTAGAGIGSFGWIGGDTRVAYYAGWIDSVVGVPEPRSWVLIGVGLVELLAAMRRRRASVGGQVARSSPRKRAPSNGFGV